MLMGLLTPINCVVSPRNMSVSVAAAAEGADVNIQTLGASCEGIKTSKDFLICKKHLAEILAVF